jgi:hypothetical protein
MSKPTHTPEAPLRFAPLLAIVGLLLAAMLLSTSTAAARPMPEGMYSPYGAASHQRTEAHMRLRYIYVTGGVGDGHLHAPDAPAGRGLHRFLAESHRNHMLPVLTYYQLQPSGPVPLAQEARAGYVLSDRRLMRDYWLDVENTLKVAAEIPGQRIVLHVEPDGWEFIEQLDGVQTPVAVQSTGLRLLRGLPDNARGFAQAFVALRNRLAPNVLLGWSLSGWGVGQTAVASVAESESVGAIRAHFYAALHARFNLALTDAPGTPYTSTTFAQSMAMISHFHRATHLHVLLWQIPSQGASFVLGDSRAASRRLRRAHRAGVTGILWNPHSTGGSRLLRIVHAYERRERGR